ncbi:hypothetical protein BDZ90DRAFT_251811 [Jaminaea rosea]|uniref:Uncharacterized protein n=1 Tax=Jaminaea rosea TaxID=1569628 RepID=A0A316UT30_9BASI|nr:hypothetical protein BDZ90DRAFT_251811 [Jaminaea rosea]PWN28154.1 hypothetical protein BDZ90DRAFT_251811 [Jaminaea rosea]
MPPPSNTATGSRLSTKSSTKSLKAQPARGSSSSSSSSSAIRTYRPGQDDSLEKRDGDQTQRFPGLAPTTSGPSIVEVSSRDQEGKIVFDNLYLNHAPGLQPVHLRNHLSSGRSVLVRLESDLGHAVSFMRRKRTGAKNELDQLIWPSNTLAWAQGAGLSPAKLRELRAISTNLEVADSLILESGASTEIFVIFRANMLPPIHDREATSLVKSPKLMATEVLNIGGSEVDDAESTSMSSNGNDTALHRFKTREARGMVTIRAWPMATDESGNSSMPSFDAGSSSSSATSSSRPESMYGSSLSSSAATALTEMSDVSAQVVKLPLTARFCRPQLAVNVRHPFAGDTSESAKNMVIHRHGHVSVDFGDVVAGNTVSTELRLINQSDIDCFWQTRIDCGDDPEVEPCIAISSASGPLQAVISSADGAAQYQPHVLQPRGTTKLTLTLKLDSEDSAAELEEAVSFTNLHNTSNSVRIFVRANIVPANRESPLVIESGEGLDFGDCCGGHWTRQLLVVRNAGEHALDIALNAQKGFEVAFELAKIAAEDLDPQDSERMSAGTSAASSDSAAKSAEPSTPVEDGGLSDSHHSIAMEMIRTPTHHASAGPRAEPPVFDLGGDTADTATPATPASDLERTPVVLTPYAHPPAPKHEPDEVDDFDNSSVASQAGSRPGSPVQTSNISEIDTDAQSSITPSSEARKVGTKNRSVLAWREASEQSNEGDPGVPPHGPSSAPATREGGGSAASSVSGDGGSSQGGNSSNSNVRRPEEDGVSVISEPFTAQSDSRSIAAQSSRASSSAPYRGGSQGSTAGVSSSGPLRNVDSKQTKEIESLLLRPGEESRIVVSFRPARGDVDEGYTAGRLMDNIFRITLDYVKARTAVSGSSAGGGSRLRGGRERKTVLCRTRTCTSFITVSPKELDFGEVNVGSRKSSQIAVTNHSDLTARVDLRFVSKVLSMYRDEMAVPSGQTIHLTVDYSPRRVNVAYSKQITVANLLNRRNDQVIDVRGRNVDKQRISFHSLFYRILTPHGSNFLEFGDVNINSSRVRTFSIENTSKAPLVLDITAAHPEDLALYIKEAWKDQAPTAANSIGGGEALARNLKGYEETEPSTIAQLNVASSGKDGKQSSQAKGAELKERFLESMSDAPANVRQENVSWRTAQKLSHFRRDAAPTSAVGAAKESDAAGAQKAAKQPVNLISALKKGGKGRTTMSYGRSVTFKDRTLVQEFEHLDLATGPPLVAKRISVKSKCFQSLEQIETSTRSPPVSAPPSRKATSAAKRPPTPASKVPSTPVKRIPSPLAKDILSKAGSPSRPVLADHRRQSSPALTGKKKVRQAVLDPTDVSNLGIDELVTAIESQPGALGTLYFNSPQAEEKHVRLEVNLQRELKNAIQSKKLVPLGMLQIPPGEERQVVAVYCPNGSTRPHIQGTARKQDSRVFLRLVEYDVRAVQESPQFGQMADLDKDELPIRDLMVRTTTCRAMLELGQPHINFGQMEKAESKTRKILVHNRSEWAASYCIRKSGSIASGDIKLSSARFGVVPAHGKREVEFSFCPTLTGPFNEKLVIENVADRDRDLTVFLKATVHKKPNFTVEPASLDFGASRAGKLTEPLVITVSNTTSKARTFVVAVDTNELRHQRTISDLVFSMSEGGAGGEGKAVLSQAEQTSIAEEIEHISQKLKIATRKGQEDKIKKYEGRLSELAVKTGASAGASASASSSVGDGAATKDVAAVAEPLSSSPVAEAALENGSLAAPPLTAEGTATSTSATTTSRLKRVSSTVTLGLEPQQSKQISLRLRTNVIHTVLAETAAVAGSAPARGEEEEDVEMNVRIHEVKNQDETRVVRVKAQVAWDGRSAAAAIQNVAREEDQHVDGIDDKERAGLVAAKGDEDAEIDPLPANDGSSVVFTPETSG